MIVVGSLLSAATTCTGFAAASIAVFGFLLHVAPTLAHAPDGTIRRATAIGGLFGFALAAAIMLLSALVE